MKSRIFIPLAISLFSIISISFRASACGPFYPVIPTPSFFKPSEQAKNMADYEREENLRLWQSITSRRIPLTDIEKVVYQDSLEEFYKNVYGPTVKSNNLFYTFLRNTPNKEFATFLEYAKNMSEQWQKEKSPWYYPTDCMYDEDYVDWDQFLSIFSNYEGKLLADRYALQSTRTLFAARRYRDCILYADSAFAKTPDANLMKRMADRYVAGCWKRLGEPDKADSLFAKTGDIWSISKDKRIELMAGLNPNAPQLMEYIRANSSDSAFMVSMIPYASKMVKDRRISSKGDWHYLLAYTNNRYCHNLAEARTQIYAALKQPFSSEEFKNLAHAYKMKIDAQSGDQSHLYADLKWAEGQLDVLNPYALDWEGMLQNIIYENWIPALWRKKDYTTAILLCSYADDLGARFETEPSPHRSAPRCDVYSSLTCYPEERGYRRRNNGFDYGSLLFQMMGSLSSEELANVYSGIFRNNPLYNFLRKHTSTDKDYFYEVIGTLALREENYARAVKYLSKVSNRYLASMNIDRDGYLDRDPFIIYPRRWKTVTYDWDSTPESYDFDNQAADHTSGSNPGAKLSFARKMLQYQKEMKHGRTVDDRGMARLMYAVGRRNSFEECWALTQYWRGGVALFYPALGYGGERLSETTYDFLYDYESQKRYKETEEIYDRELAAAEAMLQSDEAKAKANYLLGNLKTIVVRYGNTPTARFVKSSCDNWKNWL